MQEAVDVGVQPRSRMGERSRRVAWRWTQPLWWIQGAVAACTMLAVLDALGLTRKDWLPVFHAAGGRWMALMEQVSAWLAVRLPFGWDLGPYETTFFLLVLVTVVPIVLVRALSRRPEVELPERVLGFAGLVFILYGMAVLLAPGGMRDTPDVFASAGAATCVGFILSVGMTGAGAVRRNVVGIGPIVVLIIGRQLGWTTSSDGYLVAAVCGCLCALVSAGFIMASLSRSYIVAFLAVWAIVMALEVSLAIPGLGQQVAAYL